MSGGYVKIFRKVLDNPNASNPVFLAIWSYILLKATHKPIVMRIHGEDRTLNPGDLVTSCRKIADFFRLDKDTVNRALNTMQNAQMIRRKMYTRKTVISVLNWSSYQLAPDTNGDTSGDTNGDTSGDTNKKKEERRKNHKGDDDAPDPHLIASREILEEFNAKAEKNYKSHAASPHIKTIRARLNDGYSKEDMMEIIEHKVKELKGTKNDSKWLNPETLFRPKNIDRNLDFARKSDEMEEAELLERFKAIKQTHPLDAEEIRQKILAIRERRKNGKQLV